MASSINFSWQYELADDHLLQANDLQITCVGKWLHYSIATIEMIPLIGALAAIVDLIAKYVYSYFNEMPAALPPFVPPAVAIAPPAALVPMPAAVAIAHPPFDHTIELAHPLIYREPPVTFDELEVSPPRNPNALDRHGRTVLYMAVRAQCPNPELITWLVRKDAHYSPGSRDVPSAEINTLLGRYHNITPFITALLHRNDREQLFTHLQQLALTPSRRIEEPIARTAGSILISFAELHDTWLIFKESLAMSLDLVNIVFGYFTESSSLNPRILPPLDYETSAEISRVLSNLRSRMM